MNLAAFGGSGIDWVVPGAAGAGAPVTGSALGEVAHRDRRVRLHDLVVVGGAAEQVVAGRLEGERGRGRVEREARTGLPGSVASRR